MSLKIANLFLCEPIATWENVNLCFLSDELSGTKVEYGERIHHREALKIPSQFQKMLLA